MDQRTGRIEQVWSDPRHPEQRLGLHPLLDQRRTAAAIRHDDSKHTPTLAITGLLWSRGFEPAEMVLPEIEVDTFRVDTDGSLTTMPMCTACRALLPEVTTDGTRPAPEVDPDHARIVIDALDTPKTFLPRTAPHRFAPGELEDPATPPELLALVDAVENERGTTAVVRSMVGGSVADRAARLVPFEQAVDAERAEPVIRLPRDPALSPKAALDAMLASEDNPLRDAVHPEWRPSHERSVATADDLEAIDPATARQVLWLLLRHHLAYCNIVMSVERADELTAGVLTVAGPETCWWTNGAVRVAVPHPNTGQSSGGWTPLTRATFDGGVIGVDTDAILIVWLMDED